MEQAGSPLRVGFITTSFPLWPGSVSGPFVARLVNHLADRVRVTVLTPGADRSPESNGSPYALNCFRYAPRRWQVLAHGPGGIPAALKAYPMTGLLLPGFFLGLFLAAWRLARRSDVLHANWSVIGAVVGLAAKVNGCPMITTLRGQDFNRAQGSVLYRFCLKWCIRFSSRVTVVSAAMYENLSDHFPAYKDRIVFLPNGVDEAFFKLPAVKQSNQTGNRLVFIGSLVPGKGVHVLLEACASIQQPDDWHLTIIGNGPEHRCLDELVSKLGLNSRVCFLGGIAPEEVAVLLKEMAILVLPSFHEGRPNVVLEAMAAGRAVVASDIEGVRELIGHGATGLLFKPGSVDDLRKKLEMVLTDEQLRRQLGTAARQFILDSGLTWTAAAHRYTELYREVCRCAG